MAIRSALLASLAVASLALMASTCSPQNPTEEEQDPLDGSYVLVQQRSSKRGVSFNFEKHPYEDITLLGPGICWSYNWSSNKPSDLADSLFKAQSLDWCPMAWNNGYNAQGIRDYKAAHPEAEYILGFNEPNLTDQCNMTPATAAKYWPALVALAKELNMKLIAPAMNYGTLSGYSDPWKWLDEFFSYEGCSLDTVDGIAIHCYMGATSALSWYLEKFEKYGKPIWLTEFCDWDGDKIGESRQLDFMVETLNYLESKPSVFRYAWFIPRGDYNYKTNYNLLSASAPYCLTDLGKVFVNMSTWDQSVVYKPGKNIPAEQYVSCTGPVHLQPSTDGGVLDLKDFKEGCSTSYNVNLPKAGGYTIRVRYLSDKANPQLTVRCGESVGNFALMPGAWGTAETTIQMPSGDCVLTLEGTGSTGIYLNWLRIVK